MGRYDTTAKVKMGPGFAFPVYGSEELLDRTGFVLVCTEIRITGPAVWDAEKTLFLRTTGFHKTDVLRNYPGIDGVEMFYPF